MKFSFAKLKALASKESALLAAITALAAFFRLYELDRVPPGLHWDESYHVFDVVRLLQGQFAIFFPANNGREPLYVYLSTLGVAVFGADAFALRLTSAILGIFTIPIIFWFTRSLFSSNQPTNQLTNKPTFQRSNVSTRIAFFAALFSAISIWHIYHSRFGERIVLVVLLVLLALWFFWRGIALAQDAKSTWKKTYALAGVFAALAVYSYTNARLLPIVLVTLTLFAIIFDRANFRRYILGLVIAGMVALILFLPLGYYFYQHADDFLTHASNLSILDPRVNKGDLAGTFKNNLLAVAGMFLMRGDRELFRNISGRPVFDPFIGAFFVLGLVITLGALFLPRTSRSSRLRAILIGVTLIVFLSTSVLSDDAPVFTRTILAMPFAMIVAAWGASVAWDWLRRFAGGTIVTAGFAMIILASAGISYRDYFVDFANSPALYTAFDVDKQDAGKWIARESRAAQIYLAPLWYQDGTVAFETRNTTLKSFESRDTVVLPSRAAGKDALIAFPVEQDKKAAILGERLGALATREEIRGSNGSTILIAYRVHTNDLPDPGNPVAILSRAGAFAQPQASAHATWGDSPELLGYSINATDAPKRNFEVTLFLRALKPMNDDFTFSLKARDEKNRTWGQEDKWLGDNSYATSQMGAGDVVIEKFYPGLSPCALAGDYRLSVEMYNPKTGRVAALADGSTVASLGTTHPNTSLGNLYENLEPDQLLDADVAPQTKLFGYTLTPDEAPANGEFSLSLFLRGAGDGTLNRHVAVRLQNTVLAERDVTLAPEGRGLCALFDLRAPANAVPGARALFVNDAKIGTLNIK